MNIFAVGIGVYVLCMVFHDYFTKKAAGIAAFFYQL